MLYVSVSEFSRRSGCSPFPVSFCCPSFFVSPCSPLGGGATPPRMTRRDVCDGVGGRRDPPTPNGSTCACVRRSLRAKWVLHARVCVRRSLRAKLVLHARVCVRRSLRAQWILCMRARVRAPLARSPRARRRCTRRRRSARSNSSSRSSRSPRRLATHSSSRYRPTGHGRAAPRARHMCRTGPKQTSVAAFLLVVVVPPDATHTHNTRAHTHRDDRSRSSGRSSGAAVPS